MTAEAKVRAFQEEVKKLEAEIGRRIVGHKEVVRGVLTALFAGGHVLLEGVPGLGKTLLVRTLGEVLQMQFNRIQFTPDLMPADIIGTNLVMQNPDGTRVFQFQKGPVFTQILLADEINRATPKTQSAMLEAMQERRVSAGGKTHVLDTPFLVLATQNPIEMEGTYPLPEAQLDRFLVKLIVEFSSVEDLRVILDRTTDATVTDLRHVMNAERVIEHQNLVREVIVAPHVKDYIARLVWATHPESDGATGLVKKYVRFGSSPRGAQAMALSSKVAALIDGRYNVGFDDVAAAAYPALRHRILLNFEGDAEGLRTERVIEEVLEQVPRKVEEKATA